MFHHVKNKSFLLFNNTIIEKQWLFHIKLRNQMIDKY